MIYGWIVGLAAAIIGGISALAFRKNGVYNPPVVPLPTSVPEPLPVPPPLLWDTPQNVKHSIRVICDQEGLTFLQKELACDICSCESGFKPMAKLVNGPNSIDRGLFQWNSLYHPQITDKIAYDPEKSTRLACKAILAKETHSLWSASQHCWNKNARYDGII